MHGYLKRFKAARSVSKTAKQIQNLERATRLELARREPANLDDTRTSGSANLADFGRRVATKQIILFQKTLWEYQPYRWLREQTGGVK